MGALTNKLCSHFRKHTSIFFSVTLPRILRTAFLIANVLWILYKRERARHKFASSINRQTSKFVHREKHSNPRPDGSVVTCSICLSDVEDGEEVREVTMCKHAFHRKCIDEWLVHGGFCPLCRHVLMAKEMVEEHHRVVVRDEVGGGGRNHEMELAVLFLSAVHGRNCHRFT